ncbi:MAG: DUF120 domain-containing protein [Candidatus Diapherotrites archaeon]
MAKCDELSLLSFIAEKSMLKGDFSTSTAKLASHFGVSQQSISRKLRELEQKKLVNRKAGTAGITVSLTREGEKELLKKFMALEKIFARGKKETALQGSVSSGLGEGAYYLSQKQYSVQFRKLLGFLPFVGTLNLKVEPLRLEQFLAGTKKIHVNGFKTKERSFGALKCFPVRINKKVCGAIVLPERTTHPENMVEVIAPLNLRKKFGLKDGEKVSLEQEEAQ